MAKLQEGQPALERQMELCRYEALKTSAEVAELAEENEQLHGKLDATERSRHSHLG